VPINHFLRHPKTFSEIKQIEMCRKDPDLEELGLRLAKSNRDFGKKIPTLYDDLIPSSWRQIKNVKNKI